MTAQSTTTATIVLVDTRGSRPEDVLSALFARAVYRGITTDPRPNGITVAEARALLVQSDDSPVRFLTEVHGRMLCYDPTEPIIDPVHYDEYNGGLGSAARAIRDLHHKAFVPREDPVSLEGNVLD